jgi:hypothetical protein
MLQDLISIQDRDPGDEHDEGRRWRNARERVLSTAKIVASSWRVAEMRRGMVIP